MSAMVSTEEGEKSQRLPEQKTMQNAAQLAIVEDRPIMLDYWTSCSRWNNGERMR